MKKLKPILSLILVATMLLSLAACGKTGGGSDSTEDSKQPATETETGATNDSADKEEGNSNNNSGNIEYAVTPLETIEDLTGKSEAEIVGIIKKNIVKITNKVSDDAEIVATGFFTKEGYLLTNSHVVDIKGEISIEYYDGSVASAAIVANDVASDIALLYVENPKVKALNMASTDGLEVMTNVLSVGYAYGMEGEATATKGYISARRESAIADTQYLQCDAALVEGCSGSPLLNADGFVIGMNTFANKSASINLSLTTECLERKISGMVTNPSVAYIEGSRPATDISSLLYAICCADSDIYNENEILGEYLEPGVYQVDDDNWNLFFDAKFNWVQDPQWEDTKTLYVSFEPKENVSVKEGAVVFYFAVSVSFYMNITDAEGNTREEYMMGNTIMSCSYGRTVYGNFYLEPSSWNQEKNVIVFEAEGYVEVQ